MIGIYNTGTTVELRELVQSGVDIWDFDYPSYYKGDEKKAFERKVIDHFYFRSIGQETVGRFLHCFRTKIREIMPYYLDLYHSVEIFKGVEDPLESYSLTETYKERTAQESSSEGSGTSSGRHEDSINALRKHSDTPQSEVGNLDNFLTYVTQDNSTNAGTANSSESSQSSAEGSGSKDYTLTRRGNIGVQPLGEEIQKLRQAYINIDMMIIEDLAELFLKIY